MEAVVRRPRKLQRGTHTKRRFSVVGRVDLNAVTAAAHPVELTENRTISCCFRSRGSIDARVVLPKRRVSWVHLLPSLCT